MAQTALDDSVSLQWLITSTKLMLSQNFDHTAALLGRLAKKTGVQATIAIDQNTGLILKKTGDISFSNDSAARRSSASNAASVGMDDSNNSSEEVQGIEEMAMMVWKFMKAAGGLVQGLDSDVSSVRQCLLRTYMN